MNVSIRRMIFSELTFWILLCALSIYILWPLRKSLRFGIDLVGGTYLTLEVKTDKAVESELIESMQAAESFLKKNNEAVPVSRAVTKDSIEFSFDSLQNTQRAVQMLKPQFEQYTISSQDKKLTLTLSQTMLSKIKKEAVTRDVEVLRNRMGSSDITIAQQGEKNIVVELPDTSNPEEAKVRLGKAAQLEFRLVEKIGSSKEDLLLEYDGELPSDKEILPGQHPNEFYLVDRFADVTGKMLRYAGVSLRENVEPVVSFKLNEYGADKFYELTSKNYGKPLAIVLDNIVISAPRIQAAIREGGEISGRFTIQGAQELALLLTSGAFVAPVTFEEERQIGPTLGEESIYKGLLSCVVGLALLFIFSLFYYKLSGFFAFLALVYNLVLILVVLKWLEAPLTLPGIAGMVLTVGMAIDASILIFEHIKIELNKGVAVAKAVKAGFADAMVVILDANITTFIVGVVLYYFGTGPIRGFAVTMMLGIIATLITGLFFLRSIFKFVLNNFNIQKLSI